MKSKYFKEISPNNKPYCRYNLIPKEISDLEIAACESCKYRIGMIKDQYARFVIKIFTGISRNERYDYKKVQFTPSCNRRRCRLDEELLVGR